ncbi:MAG: response regulator transcription factor [Roseivirga sp.]|nr:response regulator transcription factor [Roseivirga sp.]
MSQIMNEEMTALLVDDEVGARENMKLLLEHYCPEVRVIDEAACVDEAVMAVLQHKPKVVFLDVEMPGKCGFELIDAFQSIDFQLIFVTSHDYYAVRAFDVSALDYLLKPVDPDRLQAAVARLTFKPDPNIHQKRFKAFIENNEGEGISKLAIPHRGDYDIIDLSRIMTIEADRMYSLIEVCPSESTHGKQYTYAKKLSHFEVLLHEHPHFHRVHRSWIVNTQHVRSYSKREHCLTLTNNRNIPVSKSYRDHTQSLLGFNLSPAMLGQLGS